jgi:hypothetical protein
VPITIDRITYGGLGGLGLYARVDRIDGTPAKSNSDGDAYAVPSTTTLRPGGTMAVIAHITRARLTCVADGTTYYWDNENPTLKFSALGIGSTRKPTNVHFGFLGTKTSTDASCQQ